MRKAIATVLIAGAAVAVVPGVASGVSARCGTTYTVKCRPPHVHNRPASPKCVKNTPGSRYNLPILGFRSTAGIRKIKIRLRNPPRKVYFHRFKGQGPTYRKLKHIHVNTSGLKKGAHFVRITVTDVRGVSRGKTLRFAVCASTPQFTG